MITASMRWSLDCSVYVGVCEMGCAPTLLLQHPHRYYRLCGRKLSTSSEWLRVLHDWRYACIRPSLLAVWELSMLYNYALTWYTIFSPVRCPLTTVTSNALEDQYNTKAQFANRTGILASLLAIQKTKGRRLFGESLQRSANPTWMSISLPYRLWARLGIRSVWP